METARRPPRRGRTRKALMDAALELVASSGSFGALSLRQVARRAGVVPTAFYRHFPDMESLGLALVEDAFRTLRQSMRDARALGMPTTAIIKASVATYVKYVRANPMHFQFIVKERYGGMPVTRIAIRQEIRLFVSELATDLSRFPMFDNISSEDLQVIASTIVNNITALTEEILELRDDEPEEEARVLKTAEKQLRLILLGVVQWKSQ